MGYSCTLVDTRTGFPLLPAVEPAGGRWSAAIDAVGTSQLSLILEDGAEKLAWEDATRQWDRTAVISHGGVAVHAGLLSGDVGWKPSTGELDVDGSELRAILARRFGAMTVNYTPTGVFSVSNVSRRGLATAVVREGLYKTVGDNWTLPMVIPANASGGISQSWAWSDFHSIEDMLRQVVGTSDGPDVVFDPRWNANGHLQWHVVVGSPRISGDDREWHLGVPESPVSGYRELSNAAKQFTGVFVLGSGAGEDRPVGRAPLPGIAEPRIPDMDIVVNAPELKTQAEVDAHARGLAATYRGATKSHAFSVEIGNGGVDVSKFRLGARTRLHVPPDLYRPYDRVVSGYVTKLGGDLGSSRLDVEVQQL